MSDLTLTQEASLVGSSVRYTTGVVNNGPACASGVTVTTTFSQPVTSFAFQSVNPGSWSCTLDGTATVATCTLQSNLGLRSVGQSGAVAVLVQPGTVTAFASVRSAQDDPNLDDNEASASFGTSLSFGPSGAWGRGASMSVSRPAAASIAGYVLAAGSNSALAGPTFPGCPNDALLICQNPQISVDTADTDPAQFPRVRITLQLSVPASTVADPRNPSVFRVDDTTGEWVTTALPKCGGFKGDSDIGCVASSSLDRATQVVTIIIWTSHNGHIRW